MRFRSLNSMGLGKMTAPNPAIWSDDVVQAPRSARSFWVVAALIGILLVTAAVQSRAQTATPLIRRSALSAALRLLS